MSFTVYMTVVERRIDYVTVDDDEITTAEQAVKHVLAGRSKGGIDVKNAEVLDDGIESFEVEDYASRTIADQWCVHCGTRIAHGVDNAGGITCPPGTEGFDFAVTHEAVLGERGGRR